MREFHVTYSFKSKADRDGFYAELQAKGIGDKCRAEDGNFKYDYFLPCGDDTKLFLLEQWRDGAAVDAHKAQPHFAEIAPIKEKFGCETLFGIYDVEKIN